MNIDPAVLLQLIIAVAGAVAVVVTSRIASANASQGFDALAKRVADLEKNHVGGITYLEADDRYMPRREFELTVKNIEASLSHLYKGQDEMLTLLKERK